MRNILIALVTMWLGSTAWAKPKIAILGVEIGSRTGPDAESVRVTHPAPDRSAVATSGRDTGGAGLFDVDADAVS